MLQGTVSCKLSHREQNFLWRLVSPFLGMALCLSVSHFRQHHAHDFHQRNELLRRICPSQIKPVTTTTSDQAERKRTRPSDAVRPLIKSIWSHSTSLWSFFSDTFHRVYVRTQIGACAPSTFYCTKHSRLEMPVNERSAIHIGDTVFRTVTHFNSPLIRPKILFDTDAKNHAALCFLYVTALPDTAGMYIQEMDSVDVNDSRHF